MHKIALALLASGLFACAPHIQTSSGAAFLAERGTRGPLSIDADIAAVAAVEPDIRFPARIGIARIVNRRLAGMPAQETELFTDLVARNAGYGEFVPVSPLIAGLVAPDEGAQNIIKTIRLASARQHLDYVLIYEVGARSRQIDTPFALADVTLVGGAFLPTREILVEGVGQALFLDVRNGYPYATINAAHDLSGLARTFGTDRRSESLRERAVLEVTKALIPDVEEMLEELKQRSTR